MSFLSRLKAWFGNDHLPLGRRAEDLAARYARKTLRMKVVTRNVRCPGGELDIVALDGDHLVFIEVRALSSAEFVRPEATIRGKKRRFVARSAQWYIRTRRLKHLLPRIDVIAIVWPEGGEPDIRHFPNAFPITRH